MLNAGPVKVSRGLVFHHGLADGRGYVIHSSKKHGRVLIEPIGQFADGQQILPSGLDGGAPYNKSIIAALSLLGRPYDVAEANCQHFITYCQGMGEESPQFQKYALSILGLSLVIFGEDRFTRSLGATAILSSLLTPSDTSPALATMASLMIVGTIIPVTQIS